MAKAKKKTEKKGEKRKSAKAYTLKSPIVRAYADFLAYPNALKDEDCRTQPDFLVKHGLSPNSQTILRNIAEIEGFGALVEARQRIYQSHWVVTAKHGLLKRAEGMKLNQQAVTKTGRVVGYTEEIPPETSACKVILQAFDGFSETVNVNAGPADDIAAAAARLTAAEKAKAAK